MKRQRILGGEHPSTIIAMSNLAITLYSQGKLEEAAAMRREVLEKMQRILGGEHPDTITAMSNLAITLGDQGKLPRRVPLCHDNTTSHRHTFDHNIGRDVVTVAVHIWFGYHYLYCVPYAARA